MRNQDRWNQDNVALFGFIKYPYPGPIAPEPEKHRPRPQWDKDYDHQASAEEEEKKEGYTPEPDDEPRYKDQFPGGLGDDKAPLDFDQEQLKKGVKTELEHTEDLEIALEISIDHLTENPFYYDMLETIEEPSETPTKKQRENKEEREKRIKERALPVQKRDQEKRTFIDGDEFEMMVDLANALFEKGDSNLATRVVLSLWR